MKKLFFVLMPVRAMDHDFGPVLVCTKRNDAFSIAMEVGGLFRAFNYSLN